MRSAGKSASLSLVNTSMAAVLESSKKKHVSYSFCYC